MAAQNPLKSFFSELLRQCRILILIVGTGAGLVLLSVGILAFNDAWAPAAKSLGLLGSKTMIFGYPLYWVIRILKSLMKRRS